MKRLINLFVATAILLGSSLALAASSIAVIDMQKIMQSAPQLQQANVSLKKQFQSQQAILVKQQKALQAQYQKLTRNRSVMKPADFKKQQASIAKQGNDLRNKNVAFQQQVMQAKNKVLKNLFAKVQTISAGIAKKKGYSVVLSKNATLYSASGDDITSDVLSQLK